MHLVHGLQSLEQHHPDHSETRNISTLLTRGLTPRVNVPTAKSPPAKTQRSVIQSQVPSPGAQCTKSNENPSFPAMSEAP